MDEARHLGVLVNHDGAVLKNALAGTGSALVHYEFGILGARRQGASGAGNNDLRQLINLPINAEIHTLILRELTPSIGVPACSLEGVERNGMPEVRS